MVEGIGFRFRVEGIGLRVEGTGFWRVKGVGFRFMVHGVWFMVSGSWFMVSVLWCMVYGDGLRAEGLVHLGFEAEGATAGEPHQARRARRGWRGEQVRTCGMPAVLLQHFDVKIDSI